MKPNNNINVFIAVALLLLFALGGCSHIRYAGNSDMPPVLSQDELTRPYTKLGRIRVTRESYWSDHTANPEIKEWAYSAIQREAGKMGADAVIQVEVDGATTQFGLLPTTEYRASGIAIKFK